MRIANWFCSAILLLLCLGAGAQDKRNPSTPEERKRFVAVTRDVIRAPLDTSRQSDVRWALQWLSDVPDVVVDPCPAPLEDLTTSGNRYSPKIFGIYVLAMGAYAIEHSGSVNDPAGQFQAGIEAALKAYQAILKVDPGATSDDLDDLLAKQRTGKLQEFVQQASGACKGQNESS
ncbi:MAG TPA: hypothetical protein VLW55_04020 [Burkholderiaceae bacterium]|nr:hypothetical protein [Burkholderiaceae bacterium]